MPELDFKGTIPGSKSVFNRALIVQSYFSDFNIQGDSECDDVRFMRAGLKKISSHSQIECGEGGTTFRFMSLRFSREKGEHHLHAEARLLQRPQQGLLDLIKQLGVDAHIQGQELVLKGEGWKRPTHPLQVDISESSQYASALILNAWKLPFDLPFDLVGAKVSESYFLLTMEMLKNFGMEFVKTEKGYLIPANQTLKVESFRVESDLSSAFTMASAGALNGKVVLENFPFNSAQPDLVFLEIFKKMNVPVIRDGTSLIISHAPELKSAQVNLAESPDLFPVLAVLCSWAQGESKLFGAPHLVKKESNRINKVSDLFRLLNIDHTVLPDGMIIQGNPKQSLKNGVIFNPDKDHRMVMAATLMKLKGHDIKIEEPEVINKSFPEFWQMIGIKP
ncbi:3-phosphoshikimate 1-carboxyvinyltransferase [Bdellovibrio bacteriovorus]